MAFEDATEQTEGDRQIRNNQLKFQWELKGQKITEAGIFCDERPWTLCDKKCVSLLYLSIGTKGRRLLTQKFPHDIQTFGNDENSLHSTRELQIQSLCLFFEKTKEGREGRTVLQHS